MHISERIPYATKMSPRVKKTVSSVNLAIVYSLKIHSTNQCLFVPYEKPVRIVGVNIGKG